ncbi:hypothetical protein [Marinoscillum sp. 108]|uniref:hypothetical protein n=1 Tax=Marinoscillum sp. 108 TaxID=2653151 RepID=UPI0012F2E7FF|nr:hypothetical protein [Marinoscillum sp. 108]VXD11644.1 hypothetical protein MARINOS108_10606 [Marinoscillum sp. 108]
MASLIDQIWQISQKPSSAAGFTIYTYGLDKPVVGYCVAYSDTQDCFGQEGLAKALAHAQTHAQVLGGWLDNGKFYFDSVRIYQTKPAAIEAAIKENQIGLFDLNGGYVPIRNQDLVLLPNYQTFLSQVNAIRAKAGLQPFPVLNQK